MKSIVESIQQVNEGRNNWFVTDVLSYHHEIAHFSAPDASYMWVYEEGGVIGFLTLDEIARVFHGFDMDSEFKNVKNLRPGESWSNDGENIYIRLH